MYYLDRFIGDVPFIIWDGASFDVSKQYRIVMTSFGETSYAEVVLAYETAIAVNRDALGKLVFLPASAEEKADMLDNAHRDAVFQILNHQIGDGIGGI